MASSSNNKPTVYNTNCCVFGCHSRKGADRNIHFHSFPEKNSGILVKVTDSLGQEEEVDKREAWETVLDMDKPVTKHMRVCSKHFITNDYLAKGVKMDRPKLNRYAVPSQNLPKKRSHSVKLEAGSSLDEENVPKRLKINEPTVSDRICESDVTNNLVKSEEISEKMIPRTYNEMTHDEKVVIENLLSFHNTERKNRF